MSDSLTLSNPAFRTYALSASFLVAKMMGLGASTTCMRLWTNTYGTPEDRFWPWILNLLTGNRWAPVKTVKGKKEVDVTITAETQRTNTAVEYLRGAHSNDCDNVPGILIVGALYVAVAKPSAQEAARVFGTVVAARTLHTLGYLSHLQPVRGLAYLTGVAQTLEMAARTAAALL
ncbi:hypothetical protein DFJ73DRAFT_850021 [Zopfochytrium polystomum]|nr:hypothetical protein DFJ73DRAFT_850021 [Zopfochytrium polystomum]